MRSTASSGFLASRVDLLRDTAHSLFKVKGNKSETVFHGYVIFHLLKYFRGQKVFQTSQSCCKKLKIFNFLIPIPWKICLDHQSLKIPWIFFHGVKIQFQWVHSRKYCNQILNKRYGRHLVETIVTNNSL